MSLISIDIRDDVAIIQINRPNKRNALNLEAIRQIGAAFDGLDQSVRAAVLCGAGDHFCAGLDLTEISTVSPKEGVMRSRVWHDAFSKIQFGRVPVVCLMHGAVVGGGLELAAASHVRVAEESAFFALPEGQRGIFLGGGGSVRISKIIGHTRVMEMMLTGRVYSAAESQQIGFAHYVVPRGSGMAKAMKLASSMASNASMSNFSIIHAMPSIAEQSTAGGLLTEAFCAALTSSDDEAKERVGAFFSDPSKKIQSPDGASNGQESPTPMKGESPEVQRYGTQIERRDNGEIIFRSNVALREYPQRYTESLIKWAKERPQATFLARRNEAGSWEKLTYAQALQHVEKIAQALLDRNLGVDRPVVILSGNDFEFALLSLAAMHVGIPVAPLSPSYSLLDPKSEKVRHAIDLLTPGLVFVSDGESFAGAVANAVPRDVEVVVARGRIQGRKTTRFSELLKTVVSADIDRAHVGVTGDTIAKFLFTSGSSSLPKAVVNTHRMLCCNPLMYIQCLPFLEKEEPPVMLDWLPWHHTAGGNHNFGLILVLGGTLYIDEGKPTAAGMPETLKNLREISPSMYFTVPSGLEVLATEMSKDKALRSTFFRRLRILGAAGAALPASVKQAVDRMAIEVAGQPVMMAAGLGMTETAPCATSHHNGPWEAGHIGLPVPGVEVKLAPVAGKLEIRYRGPNVTPAYWRQPEVTRQAFDEEGFFRSGDAVTFKDASAPEVGLMFDGRISEDFKLSSGTWVSVGELRKNLIAMGAPYVRDVVITGHNRSSLGVLVFLQPGAAALTPDLAGDSPLSVLVGHPKVRAWCLALLRQAAHDAGGSSRRITKAVLLAEPPSFAVGEVTDKGSINQAAVLKHRAQVVDAMYADVPPDEVIRLGNQREESSK